METVRVKYGTTERIFGTVANSSGAPVTGLTDVLLEIYRKSDGKYFDFNDTTFKSAGWTTRQQVMTELSATYSPGVYYYDFDTTGHSSAYVEESYLMTVTSATAANDPLYGELKVGGYVDQIGVAGGVVQYGKGKGMTDAQIKKLAETVWSFVLSNNKTAADTLLSKSEFDAAVQVVMVDQTELKDAINALPQDRTDEVLRAVEKSKVKPIDNTKQLEALDKKVATIVTDLKPVFAGFSDKLNMFDSKILETVNSLEAAGVLFKNVSDGLVALQESVEQYKATLAEQSDMDKRFDAMAGAMNRKNLEQLAEKIKETQEDLKATVRKILVTLTQNKYDILQELMPK